MLEILKSKTVTYVVRFFFKACNNNKLQSNKELNRIKLASKSFKLQQENHFKIK